MAEFDRILPDNLRLPGEPAFSAENENRKTTVLEGLLQSSGGNAVVGYGGAHHREKGNRTEVVAFMLTSYAGMGGGRYKARSLSRFKSIGYMEKSADLHKEMLGDPKMYSDIEVWYAPEMGTNEHNLPVHDTDMEEAYIGTGVVQGFDYYGKPIVLLTTAPSEPDPPKRGRLVTAWMPGDITVTLRPVNDDGTEKDPVPENVFVHIISPIGKAPAYLLGDVDDMFVYDSIAGGLYMLRNPQTTPIPSRPYEVIQAVAGAAPEWAADYMTSHDETEPYVGV